MQTIVARIAVERKLKMKCGQAATTESTNTINAEKIYAALPEGHFRSAIREAELTKQNPFEGLKISGEGEDAKAASVPTRETLQDIARTFQSDTSGTALLSLILMETGTRIAEFSGMKVDDVFLDAPVPYARIKPNEWRGVKTISSIRDFPLVGITLEAVRTALKLPRTNDRLTEPG